MTQPVYIISSSSMSSQHTYREEAFLAPVVSVDNGKLYVVDADYTKHISPVAIRRMSRMLKIGITAGMNALDKAAVQTPDGIIIGTSRGSVTDMEIFLKDVIRMEGQTLNPTGFIQSTYNSVNGWLAMLSKCKDYNETYVHRGFSFELCILDAQLLLAESADKKHLLAGTFDELTTEYYTIRDKVDHYKKVSTPSLDLYKHNDTTGSLAGEGAQFFVLSNDPTGAACAIHSVEMLNKPTAHDLLTAVNHLLIQYSLTVKDLDVIVSGMNGDSRTQYLVDAINNNCAGTTTIANFKHLCGEYDTASGFGVWLCDYLFRKQSIPEQVTFRRGASQVIRNMLYFNVTIKGDVSLMILKVV